MSKLMLAMGLALLCAPNSHAADAASQQALDYQKQYEEYQKQLRVYNQQMEDYKRQLREHQNAPLDNDFTYTLPGQYTAGKSATPQQQQYKPQQQYYQQYDYNDQRQKPTGGQAEGHLPNYYY